MAHHGKRLLRRCCAFAAISSQACSSVGLLSDENRAESGAGSGSSEISSMAQGGTSPNATSGSQGGGGSTPSSGNSSANGGTTSVSSANGGMQNSGGVDNSGGAIGGGAVSANGGSGGGSVPVPTGIPFGPYNLYGGGDAGPSSWDTPLSVGTASFNLSSDYADATGILQRIASAETRGLKLLMHMTGGSHSKYISNGTFDLAKWKLAMDSYNTSAITAAVAAAVANGTIIGNSVMDEPHHSSWGGVMTKAVVDDMCAYVKNIFPTLPTGVVHDHDIFEPDQSYAVCDFLVDQYRHANTAGDVAAFRDAATELGARDHHAILFSLNILDGGVQDTDNDGNWECPTPLTEGQGTYSPNCRMTASQVEDWGIVLGSAGCGLTMWRYDPVFMADAQNQIAFANVAAALATVPTQPCRRQ